MAKGASAGDVAAMRRFNRFYTRTIGVVQERVLDSEFSLAEARVLYELGHREAPRAADIAAELELDAGYLSRILASFRRRGLVARGRADGDRRAKPLTLTPRGRQALAPLERRSDAAMAGLLDGLSPDKRQRAIAAMHSFEASFGAAPADDRRVALRAHRPGDLGWIVSCHGAFYTAEHDFDPRIEALAAEIVARFIRDHDPKREHCWIAWRGGERVGSIMLVRESDKIAHLRLLYVAAEARGLGIGKDLVETCIGFARKAGYRKLVLWTNDMLHAARRIYEQAGFRLVAKERHRDFGRAMNGQTWELTLADP